jgi:DNA repair protein RadA/Sms
MKVKSIWVCQECGTNQPKWSGQCPGCSEWNSMHEEVESTGARFEAQTPSKPVRLKEVKALEQPRHASGLGELDRVLGGGLVVGSLSLVAGDPGIGKSTLMLQLASALGEQGLTVLYVCGEESVQQTSDRATRLGVTTDRLLLLSETQFSSIRQQIEELCPDVVIVDSIQITYKGELASAPGSVSQVRETATEFMHLAKGKGISILLIGHVTKSGEIAGPRVLEHLVDTVLHFEGDRQHQLRLLRAIKNRFGPTDEVAVFSMAGAGLKEVPNPSEIFLEERSRQVLGSAILPTLEGSRPILVEVQALVTQSAYSTPSRKSTGLDPNRLALLLAVLEKRLDYRLYGCDVFVSVAGGMKITEPAVDLAILMAIASSYSKVMLDPETVIVGEVGLCGEVRSVPRIEQRLKEAVRMGFKRAILPKRNLCEVADIELRGITMVEEAIHAN